MSVRINRKSPTMALGLIEGSPDGTLFDLEWVLEEVMYHTVRFTKDELKMMNDRPAAEFSASLKKKLAFADATDLSIFPDEVLQRAGIMQKGSGDDGN